MPDPNNQSGDQPITGDQAPKEQSPAKPNPEAAPEGDKEGKDGQQAPKPDQDEDGEFVKVPKKTWDKLNAKNRVKNKPARPTDPSNLFSRQRPEDNAPTEEELTLEDRREFVAVKEGIVDLLAENPKYQEVLKKDPTLKRIIKSNPLALLDAQPYDAQDAVDMITDILDERAEELTEKPAEKKDKPAPAEQKPAPQPAPQSGGNNPVAPKDNAPKSMGEVRGGLYDRIMEGNK